MHLWVLDRSQNKQRLFHSTALTDWFLQPIRNVYCAVRAESLTIIQVYLTLQLTVPWLRRPVSVSHREGRVSIQSQVACWTAFTSEVTAGHMCLGVVTDFAFCL